MSYRPKGKNVFINPEDPVGVALCDNSDFVYQHQQLNKQLEWRGNALIWTGFLAAGDHLDVPNEQLRPPLLKPDPVPLTNPRFPQEITTNLVNWAIDYPPYSKVTTTSNFYVVPPPALPENVRLTLLQNAQWQTQP